MIHACQPFEDYLQHSIHALQAMRSPAMYAHIQQAVDLMVDCLRKGGKVMVAGNGGSAADAQHFAAELIGRFKVNRVALPALALTTDTSILTAIANDFGYEQVFARQIEGIARPGDVFIGLTTSGASANILAAFATCRKLGISTLALTGAKGLCNGQTNVLLAMPSSETALIQQCHEVCLHFMCSMIEASLQQNSEATHPT